MRTNCHSLAVNNGAQFLQESSSYGSNSYSGGCLSGTGSFQNGPDILETIFNHSRQVSMSRAGTGHRLDFFLYRGNTHLFLPVLPIAVLDEQCDRAAYGEPIADAGDDFSLIIFNLHARAAPIALLATPEFFVDVTFLQRKVSYHPFNYGH